MDRLTMLALIATLVGMIHALPNGRVFEQPFSSSSFSTSSNATYDFVVVGGGTAGLVLANRLSQSDRYTVAVIEAGSFYEVDNGNNSQVPRYAWTGASTTFDNVNPLVDWQFKTEPQEGLNGAQIHYTRGKTLGGSSARNFLVYHRPTEGSLKKWVHEVGDDGYEWKKFKKYFDRSVTFNAADITKRRANSTPPYDPVSERAKSGPVQISYANYVLPFTTWALKAMEVLGIKSLAGYLDGELIGSGWNMQTTDPATMIRESSKTAYLDPAQKRSNLGVHHSTMALRVLFEGTKAVGVECSTAGKYFTISARKEVILSAGALQSPQLLMVSGIGPKETLAQFDIPVLVDAPGVGQGLEDHPAISVVQKVLVEGSTVLDTPAKNLAATEAFLRNGSGPLTTPGIDVFAWEKFPSRLISNPTQASLNSTPSDWPDIEYIAQSLYPGVPPDADDYAGIFGVLVNTFSHGTVSLRSSSMLDPPRININFLTDPRDQNMAIAAVRRMREIFSHPALTPVVVPNSETVPGPAVRTDEEILRYIRSTARTISHASSTCRMGRNGDKMAVVDSQGRVFGVKKLRVVDLSAVPFLPPGHPTATVYALAEMAAERILKGAKEI